MTCLLKPHSWQNPLFRERSPMDKALACLAPGRSGPSSLLTLLLAAWRRSWITRVAKLLEDRSDLDPPEEAESRKPTSTFTDHIILDANLVADAPAGKVEERRCRKKLTTVGQGDAFGAHEFPAVLGQPSIHGNAIARFQHIRIPSIVLFEHPGATEFYDPTRDRLPLASRISMDTLACGFDQSTFVTVPVSVTGFFQSNSEANG